jgi:signal transduction histidine kinase
MASVATLVQGIAHELNNPINYVAGNIEPLRRYGEFSVASLRYSAMGARVQQTSCRS